MAQHEIARRTLLAAGLGALLVRPACAASAIVSENGGLDGVVASDARVETRFEGGRWCEGPVWVPRLASLVFSDVRANRMMRLPSEGRAVTFRDPSANANGNAIDAQGRLITCEHLHRRVVRQEPDGRVTVMADRFAGKPLNSPNDLVVARDGAIWFTDPTWGIENPEEGRPSEPEQKGRFVFRLDSSGRLDVVSDSFEQPNGLAFSPDERVLYVSESSGAGTPEGKREIRAFDVAGGRLSRERVFAMLQSGAPDGLKCDEAGRVYAGTDGGARIWGPDGTYLGRIATPGDCANIAFGGPDGRRLYLCSGPAVHAVQLKVRGAGLRS